MIHNQYFSGIFINQKIFIMKYMPFRASFCKILLTALFLSVAFAGKTIPPNWVPAPSCQYTMSVIATLQLPGGTLSIDPNDIVGAFYGDECRGVASPLFGSIMFLSLASNSNAVPGELFTFKAYIASEDAIYDLNETMNYIVNGAIGTIPEPFLFTVAAAAFTISGVMSYENPLASPMMNTTVYLKQGGNTIAQATTSSDGSYVFNSVPSGSYTLDGACSKAWGGVNAADALMVLKHFVGITQLSGVKLAAADVDANGYINSMDALAIAKRFVNILPNFVSGDWYFQKPAVVVSGANLTQPLKAICFGDVDGSYTPPAGP